MKTVSLFLMCLTFLGNLQAGNDVAWYDYVSNNSCTPCPVTDCYSTACYNPCANPCDPCCSTWNACPVDSLRAGYSFGKGIESKHNYEFAEFMLFPDYCIDEKLVFFELDAYLLNDNKWAGSAGVGMRWQPGCCCSDILGINVFYDYRKGRQTKFNQVGLGLEWLTKTWEARINGYLPVGTKYNLKPIAVYDDYLGGYFIKLRKIEEAFDGADFEAGRNFYYRDRFRFYAGAGAAWFQGAYSHDPVWAFKARAYIQWSRYVTLEFRTYKETDDHWQCQGIASLTIPFDCLCNFYRCGLSDLYSQPVYRNAMIRKSSHCCWITNF